MLAPRVLGVLRAPIVVLAPAHPVRSAIVSSSIIATTPLNAIRAPPRTGILSTIQARHASHATSGRANKAKDGPGKRLGAKKTAGTPFFFPASSPLLCSLLLRLTLIPGEKVVTGMIIYRQRGTVWHAGENAGIGRDHTIFAMAPGFVRYYKDPAQPKRRFIGVALRESQVLPRPLNAARVRRLGRVEVAMEQQPREVVPFGTPLSKADAEAKDGFYVHRPPNWKIGRIMPKVDVKNNNPFARWQKKGKRNAAYKRRKGIA